MWVRTQKQDRVIKVDNVFELERMVYTSKGDQLIELGSYDTKKDALSVIDLFWGFIRRGAYYFYMPKQS